MLVSSIKSLPFSFFISTIFTSLHLSPPCSETACECTFHKALNTHYHTCIYRVTSDTRTRGLYYVLVLCLTLKLFFIMMRSFLCYTYYCLCVLFFYSIAKRNNFFTLLCYLCHMFSKHSISHICLYSISSRLIAAWLFS